MNGLVVISALARANSNFTILLASSFGDGGYVQPWSGPVSGVPLRDESRQIPTDSSRMNALFRGTSPAERTERHSLMQDRGEWIVYWLIKHTPMGSGETSGVCKDGRPGPVSFMPTPPAGRKWQVTSRVPDVWCPGAV